MSGSIRVADLKAHLSATLRRVKQGEVVTVMERDTPVAQIVRFEAETSPSIRIRRARGDWSTIELPPPLKIKGDIVDLLLQERGER